jgi:hypothetical protein
MYLGGPKDLLDHKAGIYRFLKLLESQFWDELFEGNACGNIFIFELFPSQPLRDFGKL